MNGSVVRQLALKDWRLHRLQVILSVAAGAAALGLFQIGREIPVVLGATWFFVTLVLLACMLPMSNVVNERKKHNLAFVMSLPISPRQYAMAKILSTFGMFLVSWAILVVAAVWLIEARFPHGVIPVSVVLTGLVLTGFCLMASVAIVSESEGWATAAIIVCNSSYGVIWYLIIRVPETAKEVGGAVAVWSPRVLRILATEAALVIFCLGLTFYLQSRKRDFI
ncbi:MAG TPA: ABC-2 transporter permease [Candidatus Aquilonibacter sp.]|nr:ABC-2 transporter permease [Candidatus Aquilonibacter sp.]